jgi:hypothetical protein
MVLTQIAVTGVPRENGTKCMAVWQAHNHEDWVLVSEYADQVHIDGESTLRYSPHGHLPSGAHTVVETVASVYWTDNQEGEE